MEKGIQVKLLLDSVSPSGSRLTTWVLKYPRFVHAELLTHRQFSRNSSSSRAIPTKRLIHDVIEDPAMPVHWGKNQSGMQAKEEITGDDRKDVMAWWLSARDDAVKNAEALMKLGCHKQIVNRIIEPWMHITVIVSTTTLSNFLKLRNHEDAQYEIAIVAKKMYDLYEKNNPIQHGDGEWHLPFVTDEDRNRYDIPELLKISTGRCARVSYLTHDGKRDISKDIQLHDFLCTREPLHASPSEHQAMALNTLERHGNFIGWKQYRKTFSNECAPQEIYSIGIYNKVEV